MNVRNISVFKEDFRYGKAVKPRPPYLTKYEYHMIVETLEILLDTHAMTLDEYTKIRNRMDERAKLYD